MYARLVSLIILLNVSVEEVFASGKNNQFVFPITGNSTLFRSDEAKEIYWKSLRKVNYLRDLCGGCQADVRARANSFDAALQHRAAVKTNTAIASASLYLSSAVCHEELKKFDGMSSLMEVETLLSSNKDHVVSQGEVGVFFSHGSSDKKRPSDLACGSKLRRKKVIRCDKFDLQDIEG